MEISTTQVLLSFLSALSIYAISRALHNLFFHPLAKFPGPKLRSAFHFPQYSELCTGNHVYNWHSLHEQYGDVVRISPETLSIIKPEAWKGIYGHGNNQPTLKSPDFYFQENGTPVDIISANNSDHTRIRRLLNHAFSEQALRSQEDIITSYITLMISKLHKRAALRSPVDIMKYLNFTTFDITGDLSFGESFDSLVSENYDHWIANMFGMLRVGCIMQVMRAYGFPVAKMFETIPILAKMRHAHGNYTKEKTARRLAKKTDRKDFVSYILRHNDERGMTHDEIKETNSTIIIGGSETSATLLSGAIYYLLKNPVWMSKLQYEIRSSFVDESQITFSSTSQMTVMNAVIHETFRLYPPLPVALPRLTSKEGATVAGTYIPPNTFIGIPQYSAYRSSRNFANPDKYAPERFLGNEEYAQDKRSVIQPFSVGPRNCIGQNMAWAVIRTILARLMWHFDFELLDESWDWEKQKVFVLWSKPSLMVKLKVTDPSDFERIMPMDYDAWRTPYNPQLKHFRPDYLTRPEAIAYIIAKNTKRLQDNNPNYFMIKVTDTNTQEIVGFAIWKLNEMAVEGDEKTVASYYPEGSEEKEFAECFVDGLWGFIAERITRRHMDLLSIVVHTSHRNRGAGRMLIRWGLDKADEFGVETAISSLPSARGAYERNGLGCIEEIPPNPRLKQRLEELEKEGKGETWRKLLEEDLSGWLMWRPVGRDWVEGDKAPWK